MANKSISALTAGAAVSSTDIFPDVQTTGVGPVKVTAAQIGDYVLGGSGLTGVLPVSRGGTGLTSLTAGYIPFGAGTSAFGNSSGLTFGVSTWGTAANSVFQITGTNASYPGRGSALTLASQDGLSNVSVANDTGTQALQFYIGTSEKMRITSTGTVNIVGAGTAGSTQAVSLNGSAPINSMVLDSSGNVGIGTGSPSQKLEVSGIIKSTNSTALLAQNSTSTGSNAVRMINASGSFYFGTENSAGTDYSLPAYAAFMYSNYSAPICFVTNGSERARIDSSGNLLVNTEARTASERMALWYSSNTGAGLNIRDTNAQNGNTFIQFNNGATTAGAITSNGTTTMTYGSASDYRLKTNIRPMENALTRVNELKPSSYTWIDSEEFGEGFIAHELQKIFPLAVVGEKDGEKMQQVDYGKLTPLLAAAIQELAVKVAELEAKI